MNTKRLWTTRCVCAVAGLLLVSLIATNRDHLCLAAAENNAVDRPVLRPGRVQQPVTLRDRLVVGLQARLKSEVAFIDNVDFRVRTGQLPQRVVDQTFFWARERAGVVRAGRTRRPIIYFQPAMAARAKALGITL